MGLQERVEFWRRQVKDRKLLKELVGMTEEEKSSAFYKDLQFGTAGIRGIMGIGCNRINVYTIRKITQGVSLYMKAHKMHKVVISYDSRNNSQLFAQEAACVFAAGGMEVLITAELMPTPFVSFATRFCKADIGIMITASHNPREYNGYKVYDEQGCQIREDTAAEIAKYISDVNEFRLRTHSFDFYYNRGMIKYMDDGAETAYVKVIDSICPTRAEGLSVVYTPLNGTGYRLIPQIFSWMGCNVYLVEGQSEPSGKFLTCPTPNPENSEALARGIKLLKSRKADILIATDPDADRIGVAYRDEGDAKILSGNEMGILMCDYLLSTLKIQNPIIVRTLVSTELVDKIAADHGAETMVVPTGFKYIGEVINRLKVLGEENRFLLGFEESQGYLVGTHVRDKDAVIASKIMVLIADSLKKQGKTFGDKLSEIYEKYGWYENKQISYRFENQDGELKMRTILDGLRENPITSIAGSAVTSYKDYMDGTFDNKPIDMLKYDFPGGNVIIRPSGTEPLIKIYICAHTNRAENVKIFSLVKNQFDKLFF